MLCLFVAKNFSKKVRIQLNIPAEFAIIRTTIEIVECENGGFEVRIQQSVVLNLEPVVLIHGR